MQVSNDRFLVSSYKPVGVRWVSICEPHAITAAETKQNQYHEWFLNQTSFIQHLHITQNTFQQSWTIPSRTDVRSKDELQEWDQKRSKLEVNRLQDDDDNNATK
jgi:hypothetical protein